MPLIRVNVDSLAQEILSLISTGGTAAVSQAQLTTAINAMSVQIQNEIDATETNVLSTVSNGYISKSIGEMLSNLTIKKTVPEIVLDSLRTNKTKISWYYNSASDMGLLFNIDGANAMRIKKDGTVLIFKNGSEVELETVSGSQTKANDSVQASRVYTDEAIAEYDINTAGSKYFSKTSGGTISGSVTFATIPAFNKGMAVYNDNTVNGDNATIAIYKQGPVGGSQSYSTKMELGYKDSTGNVLLRTFGAGLQLFSNIISFETILSNRIALNTSRRLLTTYDFEEAEGAFGDPDYYGGSNARTYYVNASSGVNALNRGLSSNVPLKTLQYALDLIEPTFLGQVQIVLKGNTNEDIRIVGKSTIKLFIDGDAVINGSGGFTPPVASLPDRVNSMTIIGCRNYVSVRGIEFLNSQTREQYNGNSVLADLCGYVAVGYCRFASRLTDTSNKAVEFTGGTSGYVNNNSYINQYACIATGALGQIRLSSENGVCSGNTIGLRAVSGGMIARYSSSNPDLGAITAASVGQGGQII